MSLRPPVLAWGHLALVALASSACDVPGTPHDVVPSGPPITIVGTSLDDQGGVVPADGALQVAFDRYLLPATVSRQSFLVVDVTNTPIVGLMTTYDPIARTVTIFGPRGPGSSWLVPDQSYKLVMPVPTDPDSDVTGLRAIDRAPLRADQRRAITFRAGPPAGLTELEPSVDFCADVLPLFTTKCARCHGSAAPAAAGLVLDTPEGIRLSARGRIAQGSSRSARSETTEPAPPLFGANLEILRPNEPGSSWLLYKVELARLPTEGGTPPEPTCGERAAPYRPLVRTTDASDAERRILGEHVLGREMPSPTHGLLGRDNETPLTFDERERLRIWIARGAEVRACASCASTPARN